MSRIVDWADAGTEMHSTGVTYRAFAVVWTGTAIIGLVLCSLLSWLLHDIGPLFGLVTGGPAACGMWLGFDWLMGWAERTA